MKTWIASVGGNVANANMPSYSRVEIVVAVKGDAAVSIAAESGFVINSWVCRLYDETGEIWNSGPMARTVKPAVPAESPQPAKPANARPQPKAAAALQPASLSYAELRERIERADQAEDLSDAMGQIGAQPEKFRAELFELGKKRASARLQRYSASRRM